MFDKQKQAIILRKKGQSLSEIAKTLHVAKSSASLWVRNITLSSQAKEILNQKKIGGQKKGIASLVLIRRKKQEMIENRSDKELKSMKIDKTMQKILCSFLYWAEGEKTTSNMSFINSDPTMIKTFLILFRSSFQLDEAKFRALVHIHNYHNDEKIKQFWSKITKIPLKQFNQSYNKPHTGKRLKKDYKGCIRIKYYDSQIAYELKVLYNKVSQYLI